VTGTLLTTPTNVGVFAQNLLELTRQRLINHSATAMALAPAVAIGHGVDAFEHRRWRTLFACCELMQRVMLSEL